jgi:hypothetical protein
MNERDEPTVDEILTEKLDDYEPQPGEQIDTWLKATPNPIEDADPVDAGIH